MTLLNTRFLSEREAEKLDPMANCAMISITNPGAPANLKNGWPFLLRVEFADCTYTESTIEFLGRIWPVSSYGFPEKSHALAIIDFLNALPASCEQILVHCGAGVSRSAAVARYIALRHGLPFPDDYDRYNITVYELLENPRRFDQALASFVAEPAPPPSLWSRIKHGIGLR